MGDKMPPQSWEDDLRVSRERLNKHLPDEYDLTLTLLKGHLIVEEEINELLELIVPRPEHLSNARFGFIQRLRVLQTVCAAEALDRTVPAIKILNNARNALAHQLEPKEFDKLIQNFNNAALRAAPNISGLGPLTTYPDDESKQLHQKTMLRIGLSIIVGNIGYIKRLRWEVISDA